MATAIRPVGHEDRLSVVEHLDELRSRLIIAGVAFVAAFALCLVFNHQILTIINKPLQETTQKRTEEGKGILGQVYLLTKTMQENQASTDAISDVTELHVCGSCESDLVYPTEWDEAGSAHWEVSLRCPNCEWTLTGTYGEETIQRFDETLDHGTEELVSDLRELTRANMEDDVERFVRAISAGFVLPEDF